MFIKIIFSTDSNNLFKSAPVNQPGRILDVIQFMIVFCRKKNHISVKYSKNNFFVDKISQMRESDEIQEFSAIISNNYHPFSMHYSVLLLAVTVLTGAV